MDIRIHLEWSKCLGQKSTCAKSSFVHSIDPEAEEVVCRLLLARFPDRSSKTALRRATQRMLQCTLFVPPPSNNTALT
jgi:hypothetical protein